MPSAPRLQLVSLGTRPPRLAGLAMGPKLDACPVLLGKPDHVALPQPVQGGLVTQVRVRQGGLVQGALLKVVAN
jgi:hypothetical protein